MKVHLIKSKELSLDVFEKVGSLLDSVSGPIEFVLDLDHEEVFDHSEIGTEILKTKEDFYSKRPMNRELTNFMQMFPMERDSVSWDVLFKKCARYRKEHKAGESDFVFLLTDKANDLNWFSALDENQPFNGFVHTADWERFIGAPSAFPIAYEIVALILQKYMFASMKEVQEYTHKQPLGCVNDMCINKKEIMLKLRTADICPTCIKRIDPAFKRPMLNQMIRLMENLRVQMLYAQNFRQSEAPSKMIIKANGNILLPDYSNMNVHLRPLEKVLYLLFLRHPEGIYQSNLSDHKNEMYAIYGQIGNAGSMEEMKVRIDALANALENSANEKISRIKKAFDTSLGDVLMQHYIIQGPSGERKNISLDRSLVEWELEIPMLNK